jgi:hypothetical protein
MEFNDGQVISPPKSPVAAENEVMLRVTGQVRPPSIHDRRRTPPKLSPSVEGEIVNALRPDPSIMMTEI